MAYFNHAFQKCFLGAGDTAGPNNNGWVSDAVAGGGVDTVDFYNTYGPGTFDFVYASGANAWSSVGATAPANGEPLVLIATSLYQNDKVGPYHGGYQETTKSKMINPKYVNRFYKVQGKLSTNEIVTVGQTSSNGCPCPEFYCNETYGLRIDVKGSPALRYLNHNAYEVACAYTGCCDGPTPELVDPASVMMEWATYLLDDPIFSGFEGQYNQRLIRTGFEATIDGGVTWIFYVSPDMPAAEQAAFLASIQAGGSTAASVDTWDNYDGSGFAATPTDYCAGLVLEAAYAETKFGDCTFQVTDFFEKEPVQIFASLLDETGDPCVFESICVEKIQVGMQGMGFGEQVLRDLVLSESYSQNTFNNSGDMRIREITQGYDISNAVDRNDIYTCYFILHSVPRANNPTSVFDNDQYLLAIPVLETQEAGLAAFETFVDTWLSNAGNIVQMETF